MYIAVLPNSWKQTQRDSHNEETNTFQIKGQHKTPEKALNEMKTSNLSDKEIKTIVIKMLNKLRRNIRDELSENVVKNNINKFTSMFSPL